MLDDALIAFLETNPRTQSLSVSGWTVDVAVAAAQGAPMTLLHTDGWKAVIRSEQDGTLKLTMMGKANPQLPAMPSGGHGPMSMGLGMGGGCGPLPPPAAPAVYTGPSLQNLLGQLQQGVLQAAGGGANPPAGSSLPPPSIPVNGPEYYITISDEDPTLIIVAHRDKAALGMVDDSPVPAKVAALLPGGGHYADGVWELDAEPSDPAGLVAALVHQGLGWDEDWHNMVHESSDPVLTAAFTAQIKQRLAQLGPTPQIFNIVAPAATPDPIEEEAEVAPEIATPPAAPTGAAEMEPGSNEPWFFALNPADKSILYVMRESTAMKGKKEGDVPEDIEKLLPMGWWDEAGTWTMEDEIEPRVLAESLSSVGMGWKEEYQRHYCKTAPASEQETLLTLIRAGLEDAGTEEGHVARRIVVPNVGPDYYIALDPEDPQLLYVSHRSAVARGGLDDDFAPSYIRPFLPAGGPCDPGAWEMDAPASDPAALVAGLVAKGLGWNEEWQRSLCPTAPSQALNQLVAAVKRATASPAAPRRSPGP